MTIAPERPTTAPAADDDELAYSIDPYDPRTNATNFDLQGWLATFDERMLATSEGRRLLTRLDPMLFAYIYMRRHLRDSAGEISFSDAHFLWLRLARRLIGPSRGPREDRRALVAPRSCGKTTWWFLIIPMWAGAHKHARFAAAFADSGVQAELHLATFKREQAENALLRADYLDFCEPKRRHDGKTMADTQQMLYTRSGFAFAARGIDSTSLGMKIDEVRPDLLIFDDIEPPEATYSPYQRDKRLSTVQNAVLPLNERARVILVGTVTMPGSIVHSLVRAAKGEETESWIVEERFKTHHTHPIVRQSDGTERSVWPNKWPMAYLNTIRKTRSYKLNFDNDPRGRVGELWNEEDIVVVDKLPQITKRFLFVDPPVTMKKTSDPCGLAILGYAPALERPSPQQILHLLHSMGFGGLGEEGAREAYKRLEAMLTAEEAKDHTTPKRLSRIIVLDAWEKKVTGKLLRRHVVEVLAANPGILAVAVENNQGGDLWLEVFEDLPVKLVLYPSVEAKEVRLSRALTYYQNRRVLHAKEIPTLVDQLTGFPKMAFDDVADAVCSGIVRLLGGEGKKSKRHSTATPR